MNTLCTYYHLIIIILFLYDPFQQTEANLEEDMGVGGATADDEDQEFIRAILENEIVGE